MKVFIGNNKVRANYNVVNNMFKNISVLKVFIPAVLLVFVFSVGDIVLASSDLIERQQNLTNEMQGIERDIAGVQGRITATQQQLDNIEVGLLDTIVALDNVISELEITRAALTVASAELEEAKELRAEQQERFITRARAMYMNGPTTYLDVLLSSSDFTDLLVRMEFVSRIVEHDQNLITDLLATEEVINDRYETINAQEQQLIALEFQHNARRVQYEDEMEVRFELMSSLTEEEQYLQNQHFSVERSIREVENLIRSHNRAARVASQGHQSNNAIVINVENLDGQLAWPVPGRTRVSSGYGQRRNPISGRSEFHTGIDIPAPTGTYFISPEYGVVIFSGWKNGFGNTVIVDHGDGISTLHAHNSRNLVSQGEGVRVGQALGRIGSTGFSTGPHSHFEVRFNGRHVDPMPFLN